MWQQFLKKVSEGDVRALARGISLIENEAEGYDILLQLLLPSGTPVIGITGPPGAGKSTIVDALTGAIIQQGKKVGILCIDPSSPFHFGALLGDRIRMSQWYNHPNVYIRSLAARGSLGGLHPKIIEICDLLKAAPFDCVIIETVGVGQSEIEIAGLADVTVVVLVPESGDEIQTMKAGLMEIADIFVVNKSDRPDADLFVKNLRLIASPSFRRKHLPVPVIKTIASQKQGITELYETIITHASHRANSDKRNWLLAEKAFFLIQQKRMKGISRQQLKDKIEAVGLDFNLYRFIQSQVTLLPPV